MEGYSLDNLLESGKFSSVMYMSKDTWHPRVRAFPEGFVDDDTVMACGTTKVRTSDTGELFDYDEGDEFIRAKVRLTCPHLTLTSPHPHLTLTSP